MELGSYFLFLQEQIKDIIITLTPDFSVRMNVLDSPLLGKLPTGAPAHAATYASVRRTALANWNSYPLCTSNLYDICC